MSRLRFLIIYLALPVLMLAHASTYAQGVSSETAVLLGIRVETPEAAGAVGGSWPGGASAYRSFLIIEDDAGSVSLIGERDGLIVPRGTGLWLVDVRRSVYNRWEEDILHAAPLGAPSKRSGIQSYNGEFCRGSRELRILFASAEYLGVDQRTEGYCEDAAHPWAFATLGVIPADTTAHTGVPIGQVLGRAGADALRASAQQFLDQLNDPEDVLALYAIPDAVNWSIVRSRGQWTVRGRLDSEEAAASRIADYPIRMELPPSFVGLQPLPLSWARVRAVVPDALDAVASPGGDVLFVLRPGGLSVHALLQDHVGPAQQTWQLPLHASAVVMTRWTKTDANLWRKAFGSPPASNAIGWQSVRP